MALDTSQKQTIIEAFKVHEKDTGSPEVQIALLTERIRMLTEHFKNSRRITIPGGVSCPCGNEEKAPQLSQGDECRQVSKGHRKIGPEKIATNKRKEKHGRIGDNRILRQVPHHQHRRTCETGRRQRGDTVRRYGATGHRGGGERGSDHGFPPPHRKLPGNVICGGKFPGGFFKREGRPSEREVLTSRLIDRPLRPTFVKGYRQETQIIATVLSADQENDPATLGIIGAQPPSCFPRPLSSARLPRSRWGGRRAGSSS